MKKNVLPGSLLIVLSLFMFACSPSDKTVPVTETPVLQTGQTVHFTLLQTTDLHHHVVGTGPSESYGTDHDTTKGGFSRLAKKINDIRNLKALSGIPTVLVDSGDYFMGTVYDMSLAESPAALMFFQSMKYDAITIGNHELDYGQKPFSGFINLGITGPANFQVPIVASNMVTTSTNGNADDGIKALQAAGAIKDSVLLTLSNGLKVGIIGILGSNADADVPLTLKSPLTFDHDMNHIQAKVIRLRSAGAQVVVALSHSGITNPNGAYGGDDVTLAQSVMGIDIIASGHEHEMTNTPVVVSNGVWNTLIVCAGKYGENLSQLDVTFTVGTGVIASSLTNNTIDKTVPQDDIIKTYLVGNLDLEINKNIALFGLPGLNDVPYSLSPPLAPTLTSIELKTDSDNLSQPTNPGQSGMGNLVADSLRYLLGGANNHPSLGIVANGIIRNGFASGQRISLADIYNTLPLGMTMDTANQNIPGYPLLMVYMDQTSILNLCQLAAWTIAAHDTPFMTALLNSGIPSLVQKYYLLQNLKSDYYLNLSGVRYTYGADYSVTTGNVGLYGPMDYSCQSAPPVPLAGLGTNFIPCVIDLYTAMMFISTDMQNLLTSAGLTIKPKVDNLGTIDLSLANIIAHSSSLFIEKSSLEVKEWQALLNFLNSQSIFYTGLPSSTDPYNHSYHFLIPDSKYGTTITANTKNACRVNHP